VPLPGAASAFLHAPPADALVTGLKYHGWTALAPRMSGHMVEPARRLAGRAGVAPALVAVPLDPRRARRRGFNQAALLADGLAEATGWPRHTGGLVRRRTRRHQAELGRVERMANVLAACYWETSVPIPSRPVLLVDDVLTTGATAAAGAAAIEAAGGRCLGVVTFARSLPRPDAD
jgi:predicted amidophosphoribosyltransferase